MLDAKEPRVRPTKICATVVSERSAITLRKAFEQSPVEVHVTQGQNVHATSESDVIILACPPDVASVVLGESGMPEALQHKVLISILAGVERIDLETMIYGDKNTPENAEDRCSVVRALPNVAVASGASATAIAVSEPKLPDDKAKLVDTMFEQLGGIVHVPASLMNASTVLCGSTPAFIALFMDGLIDGAVAAGVPRATANAMAAQVLGSTAALMKDNQRPSALRESVCAMPGCTIQGNIALEEGNVRGASARAMKTAIEAASRLG